MAPKDRLNGPQRACRAPVTLLTIVQQAVRSITPGTRTAGEGNPMDQFPVVIFVVPVFVVCWLIFFLTVGRRRSEYAEKAGSHNQIGAIAQRMGLQVIEGDPTANLVAFAGHFNETTEKVGGRVRRFLGDEAKETRIMLRGAPYGRPTEFYYYHRTTYADRHWVKFHGEASDCRFSLQVPVGLPPFELVLHDTSRDRRTKPEWGLPRQSFGDPALDARFTLTCHDPRLGPALVPAMGELAGHRYLHVQANGQVLQVIPTEEDPTVIVESLEQTQRFLEYVANILTGPAVRTRAPEQW
jgi:hypothetical protein